MNNKNKIAILSLIALAIIGILSGASYAYFSVGNKSGNNTVIESGTMALTFTDGPQINATNLIPGEYIEKTFSVRNTGTVSTTYDVYLSEVINTFVQKSDLVYEITSNDGGYNTPSEVVVPNEESKIINQQSIGVGITHNYTLKITYKLTNQVQNDNMGRGFTAKININEYTTNNSEHLLKLLDTSNNIVDKQMISSGITDYYYNLANTSLTGTTNIYCNNGGIPTIENNILKVSDITNDTECKMSSDIVDTFTNKLSTTKTGIVMTNNQDNTTRLLVPESKEVVFDLNGKTINSVSVNDNLTTDNDNNVIFKFAGILTVNDSIGNGGLYTGTDAVVFQPIGGSSGKLYINGGNFSGKESIFANAKNSYIEINGGNFGTKSRPNIGLNSGTIVINDIDITSTFNSSASFNQSCSENACTLTINGGNFNTSETAFTFATGVGNTKGVININGGNFVNNAVEIFGLRAGEININEGNFKTPNSSLLHKIADTGTAVVNINGGNFDNIGSTGLGLIKNYGGIFNINNGVFKSSNCVVRNNGIINISGGDFESDGDLVIYNLENAKVNINGNRATFDSSGNYVSGIYLHNMKAGTDSTVKYLIQNNGDMDIYNGTFRSRGISLLNGDGTLNVYDGDFVVSEGAGTNIQFTSAAVIQIKPYSGTINLYGGTFESKTGFGIRRNGPGTINVYNANVKTYDYYAVNGNCDNCNEGSINICKINLMNNKGIYNGSGGNTYYHTNAFGSVTPTFYGNTANIQVKDSVCD